jgi:hypothetical protein
MVMSSPKYLLWIRDILVRIWIRGYVPLRKSLDSKLRCEIAQNAPRNKSLECREISL